MKFLHSEPRVNIIGSIGWWILELIEGRNALLGSALSGIGHRSLPLVNGITTYNHCTLGTILLGVGKAGHVNKSDQTELLLNSHNLCKNNVNIDDVMLCDGGKQCILIDRLEISLISLEPKQVHFTTESQRTMRFIEVLYIGSLQDHQSCTKLLKPQQDVLQLN